jgi:hypothetical protein
MGKESYSKQNPWFAVCVVDSNLLSRISGCAAVELVFGGKQLAYMAHHFAFCV